jgi:hypothetical protein
MGIFLQEMVFDLPRVVDAEAVGQLHLIERFAEEALFGACIPGPRQLMLVENAELHRSPWSCIRSTIRADVRRQIALADDGRPDSRNRATMKRPAGIAGTTRTIALGDRLNAHAAKPWRCGFW